MKKYKYEICTDKNPTKYIIYLAISPSKKRYIGVTTKRLNQRIKQHLSDSKQVSENQRRICLAIKKYGIENFEWRIIDYANNVEEMFDLEKYWIEKLGTLREYNISAGGKGGVSVDNRTYEQREHYAYALNNKFFYVYCIKTKELVGKWYNKTLCAEQLNVKSSGVSACLRKIIWQHKGYLFSYEPKTIEEIDLIIDNRKKPRITNKEFYVFTLDGKLIGSFTNQMECKRVLKLHPKTPIDSCLNNKIKQSNNYIFSYNKKVKPFLGKPKFHVYNKIPQKYIGEYDNQRACATELKLDTRLLNACLKGKRKSHKGYIFFYTRSDPFFNVS